MLESLRPAWHLLDDVIFEMQVGAWAIHGVELDDGLRTLRQLIAANDYRVVTLPHTCLGCGRGGVASAVPVSRKCEREYAGDKHHLDDPVVITVNTRSGPGRRAARDTTLVAGGGGA